jgi:F420-non-reducing hydrogenase iron-sulfur subunit
MKIVAFLCNWCSYEASMGAGSKRLACPSDVAFIRVMCTGMINPQTVLAAFANGADGVLILGCHPGDCHYKEGNYHAIRRVAMLEELLDRWGIDRARLMLDWASASEADRFAQLVNAFHKRISEMGAMPEPAPALEFDQST